MLNKDTSKKLFAEAKNHIPGGVNSPVRAFKAVGGDPIFMKSAKGAVMTDVDGNQYVDMINSWGPMIIGHAHPEIIEAVQAAVPNSLSFGTPASPEVEIAELINKMMPSIEKVRMVNSGTEATMSAIRLARGYTNRDKVIKFEGCYHGHGDSFLIAAGSGLITMGEPNSPGVTKGTAKDTLTAPYNDLEAVTELVKANSGEVAAIIIEPVAGNMGCVVPKEGYLEGLRKLCDEEGVVLIFDEVMTGFRLSKGGAQERLGVTPDITTLGKIIGGGMPVGAYGGKAEIMDFVSPQGPVYQAGTLSGNPISMAAGLAMLRHLDTHPEVYERIDNVASILAEETKKTLKELGLNYTTNEIGSMHSLFFTDRKVNDFEDAKSCDTALFGRYFNEMLERGIYLAPSQFETLFICSAMTDEHVEQFLKASKESLKAIH
ncbi:glutamate-1-semialdehyde 2,1-aminomutase [Fulvitalea axinellae]|uniref:Glutamate-1-semialdehyde 2,1-aminomutase n=1 Tax=Fulvitalea axinellae TaxID=1182444 RepID=A0AAU9D843_9BACT|nr:glutamate-1-semialdehyde 2,1-aminomutase [Fulvitalea axinellae]